MKRKNCIFLTLLMMLALTMAGCGSGAGQETAADDGSTEVEVITVDEDSPISEESIDMDGFLVTINTEGMGEVARAEEGRNFAFDDEYPAQSTIDHLKDGTKLVIGARANYDDWVFVKWTLNGEDFTTDEQFTYTVTEDADFIAVFDIVGVSDMESGALPLYIYSGDDDYIAAISDYLTTEIAFGYLEAAVSIPYIAIVDTDDSDPEDILVWGDFWIMNYDLDGDILTTVSGGNHPGLMHLQKNSDGSYTVKEFEQVEDGSGWDESAKKIFGDRYDAFIKIQSDDAALEEARAEYIRDYVETNGLAITAYQDYGWDAVELY